MKSKLYTYLSFLVFLLILICPCSELMAQEEDDRLRYQLRQVEKPPPDIQPKDYMYSKGDFIYCTGKSEAALANNKAADLMEEGDFKSAEAAFKQALKHAPLFFPFRYNIGICYIHLHRLKLAHLNLKKASNLLPEFHKTYVEIGYIYERWQKNDTAITCYRKALKKNRRAHKVYVLVGDLYLGRNQLEMAKKYYEKSLDIVPKSPNALLGRAKIHFKRKEYYKAILIIKYIPLEEGYDKSLHYYFAECAYKLRDYKTAHAQYSKLLEFRNDKFFLTNSVSLIKHKLDLCGRFTSIE